jgi:hypothetical protein
MDKIICSLEEWDSVINYYRPNGSSKTWYLKELKKLSRPLMWGDWNIFSEDGVMFPENMFHSIITPIYCKLMEYASMDNIGDSKHIYIINVYTSHFFVDNLDIGFSCISPKYLEDVKNGNSKILMFFVYEGYSGADGNYDLEIIEKWRKDANLPEDSIYYVCGNFLIQDLIKHKGLKFQGRGIHFFEPWNKYQSDEVVDFKPQDDKYLFLSYNRQPRHHRIQLMLSLMKYYLFKRGTISLYQFEHDIPDGANEIHYEYLHKNAPFIIDPKYDLHYNLAVNITKEDYERTFISLVTETLVDDGTLFFSEKVWKPIMVGHPFLLYGNKHSLKFLKELGYKTFDKWIDESYDNEPDRNMRCEMIVEQLNKFKNMSIEELTNIRNEMKSVCEFNQLKFKELYFKKYGRDDMNSDIKDIMIEVWENLNKDKNIELKQNLI